jgi:hypothetical protein
MVVTRRVLLKQLTVVSAGIALVPDFISCTPKPSLLFRNISVTKDQEEILGLIAETIIPKTDTPGANEVSTQVYVAKMIDDCLSRKDQEKWLTGLNQFTTLTKGKNKGGFVALTAAERESFLKQVGESKEENEVNYFYKTTRRFTLRGYTTSEYFLTKQNFSLIPGPFKGCVPVNSPS